MFNTSHLTSLFDRVIVASGTSNRQTKALASNVGASVKEAGGEVISIEGEDVGEWVLVDCGDAVVHIFQPALRQYYRLEEIWGDKPVRIKLAQVNAFGGAQRQRTGRRRRGSPGTGAGPPRSAQGTRAPPLGHDTVKLSILAVGHRMPDWIATGFDEYVRRMPPELRIELREIKPEQTLAGAAGRQRHGG